jgi:hypothetical protein
MLKRYLVNSCVSVITKYYPEGSYRIYKKQLRDDTLALYIHDQQKRDRSVIVWIVLDPHCVNCLDNCGVSENEGTE